MGAFAGVFVSLRSGISHAELIARQRNALHLANQQAVTYLLDAGLTNQYASPPRRTRQEWLELSMDALWTEWLYSDDQTFDEWYSANIPAPDIPAVPYPAVEGATQMFPLQKGQRIVCGSTNGLTFHTPPSP